MRSLLVILPLVIVALACSAGSDDSGEPPIPEGGPGTLTPACEPDTVTHCEGDGGCLGGKLCGQDGTYGECVCIGDTGSTAPSDAPADDAGAPRDAAADSPDGTIHDAAPDARDARARDAHHASDGPPPEG